VILTSVLDVSEVLADGFARKQQKGDLPPGVQSDESGNVIPARIAERRTLIRSQATRV